MEDSSIRKQLMGKWSVYVHDFTFMYRKIQRACTRFSLIGVSDVVLIPFGLLMRIQTEQLRAARFAPASAMRFRRARLQWTTSLKYFALARSGTTNMFGRKPVTTTLLLAFRCVVRIPSVILFCEQIIPNTCTVIEWLLMIHFLCFRITMLIPLRFIQRSRTEFYVQLL